MAFKSAAIPALALTGLLLTGSSATTEKPTAHAAERPIPPATDTSTVGLVPAAISRMTIHAMPRELSVPASAVSPTLASADTTVPPGAAAKGIPGIVLAAYRNAERELAQLRPSCGLDWTLLAGIGRIESGHAGNGRVNASGTTLSPILGPPLDGSLPGNEIIRSTRGGFVRAVGPMQFLPETWAAYGSDGNGDGVADPNNVFDAALAAGKYLCADGGDLHDPNQRFRAILRYNNSAAYASNVLSWATIYAGEAAPAITTDIEKTPVQSQTYSAKPETTAPSVTSMPEPENQIPQTNPPQPPAPPMIRIPGLPPIPCGIFCPPPPPER
jgi:membrane-bound lytic murein transglycosylase B